MKNFISELFMSEYFLYKAVLGKHLPGSRVLFNALGKMCFLSDGKLKELYRLIHSEEVENIATEQDYMQYRRIRQYAELIGMPQPCTPELDEIINVKGSAIAKAAALKIKPETEVSQSVSYSLVASAANAGLIPALRMLGVMQCEGVFVDKNEKAGIANLSKCACWNDIYGILALLNYCEDTREYNVSRLNAAVKDTPYEKLYFDAVKRYGVSSAEKIKEVRLLEKAFNSSAVKRETFDPRCARILYCNALHLKDKEDVIFTESKELLSIIAALPLKLSFGKTDKLGEAVFRSLHLQREEEIAKIQSKLKGASYRNLNSYRPLCLCSDSEYVLNMYADAILSNPGNIHVERIDVSELNDYDLEPTPSNIFMRTADEDKDNYYLLFFCGEISERTANAVKSFLQSSKRSRFHLNSPCTTLDLSGILPICFSDKNNVKLIEQFCDVIRLSDIDGNELPAAIDDMLSKKKKLYRLSDVSLDNKMYEEFKSFDIDSVEKILDSAVREYGVKGEKLSLTEECLSPVIAENSSGRIGFGFGGQLK